MLCHFAFQWPKAKTLQMRSGWIRSQPKASNMLPTAWSKAKAVRVHSFLGAASTPCPLWPYLDGHIFILIHIYWIRSDPSEIKLSSIPIHSNKCGLKWIYTHTSKQGLTRLKIYPSFPIDTIHAASMSIKQASYSCFFTSDTPTISLSFIHVTHNTAALIHPSIWHRSQLPSLQTRRSSRSVWL
jgi:hypothetical protein